MWIKNAGKIVNEMVKTKKETIDSIEILEMDELFTYVKKTKKTLKQENSATHIPEFGLLWIETEMKLLRLK